MYKCTLLMCLVHAVRCIPNSRTAEEITRSHPSEPYSQSTSDPRRGMEAYPSEQTTKKDIECIYVNSAWSTCDLSTLKKTKSMKRSRPEMGSGTKCTDWKNLTQSCSNEEIISESRSLVEKERKTTHKLETYRQFINKTLGTLDNLEKRVSTIQTVHQQSRQMRDSYLESSELENTRKKLKQVEEENLALKNKNTQLKTDYNNLKTSYSGCISPEKNNDQMEKLKNLKEDNSELKKIIDYGYGAKNTHGLPGEVNPCEQSFKLTMNNLESMRVKMKDLIARLEIQTAESYKDNVSCQGDIKKLTALVQDYKTSESGLKQTLSKISVSSIQEFEPKDLELTAPASDDGTVTMLKQMRDQMERINFKEIQLFDSIIAKMSEKKNAASNKLVARLKDQEELIQSLVSEAGRSKDTIDGLTALVSRLRQDKERADTGLNTVSRKLKDFKDSMLMVLHKYNTVKRSAVDQNKFNLCLNNLDVYRSKFETSMMLVNTIRTVAQRFREDFIVKLISKMKMLQQKNKEQSLTIMRQQQSIRMNEDELEKIGDYLTHFVKEMKTFGSKYTGLQRKLNDTIKTKNVDFVKIKYGLEDVKEDSHKIYNMYKNENLYKEDYLACTYRVHEMEKLADNSLSVLQQYKGAVQAFRRDYLTRLIQKLQSYQSNLELERLMRKEKEKEVMQLYKSLEHVENTIRHFKLEFQEFNAKYFQLEDTYTSVKNNMTELKKHDEQRLNNIGGDLGMLMNNMQRIIETYKTKLKEDRASFVSIKDQLEKFKNKMKFDMDCEEKLQLCLDEKEEYRTHLRTEQMQLYKCNVRFYRGQKVLKDVNEFYIYLMDRLVRLHDGIHNLKLIGINLRDNLVTVHAAMGHCTGNLQALRHECQGLVSWYQTLPNMEILKRKLSTCQQQAQYNENSPTYLFDQIREQKDKFARIAQKEENCERRLKESMTEMIALTRHYHTQSGKDDSDRSDYTAKNQENVLRINKVLYDQILNSTGVSREKDEILRSWNSSNLSSTEKALKYLFGHWTGSQISHQSYQTEISGRRIIETDSSNLTGVYLNIVEEIKTAMHQLNDKKDNLITKLKKCQGKYPDVLKNADLKDYFPKADRVTQEEDLVASPVLLEVDKTKVQNPELETNVRPHLRKQVPAIKPGIPILLRNENSQYDSKNRSEVSQNLSSEKTSGSLLENISNTLNPTSMSQETFPTVTEASVDDLFSTTVIPGAIDLERLQGLLNSTVQKPPTLKPLEDSEKLPETQESLDKIRSKMLNIKEQLVKQKQDLQQKKQETELSDENQDGEKDEKINIDKIKKILEATDAK
ncbi:desmoplakin isoform X5 [Eurytemora carolleeae]|uniref:desmoplakin isoform X5 n=1 Tax=Eurytemora carolleeae TaxID=1294199 RepID=UPI000C75F333|nr:desmoplakin isoform X5 [Eurytemora carolleeae]|eukprot:XP_023344603.1 desmoplakin-like isoform X5 [Eurytemora affinis]